MKRIEPGRRARTLAAHLPGLFIALALTGCATTERFTTVHCLTQAQYEELKKQQPGKIHDQLNGDAAHDVGPLAGNAIRLRAYSDGLLTVLGGCVDPNKTN